MLSEQDHRRRGDVCLKRILMTGSTGFIGQNVLPILQNKQFDIYAPTRAELNLKSEGEVAKCLKDEKFDTILHLANPTPGKNSLDSASTMTDDSLRIFLNLYNHSDLYGKMIYSGSGAEFDKSQDIDMITESECFRSVPKDSYGLAKMAMNHMALQSSNIYNFRIFGCYGPRDHESKFARVLEKYKSKKALFFFQCSLFFAHWFVLNILDFLHLISTVYSSYSIL